MKIENNGFACGVHVVDANGLARYVAAHWNNETCEERATDMMQAVPMLGGLIYEAVMERNSVRALNDTSASDDVAFRTLAQCRETKDAVLEIIAGTILPQLIAWGRRKAG